MRMIYRYPSTTKQNVVVEIIKDDNILKKTFDYKIIEDDIEPTEQWNFNPQYAYEKADELVKTQQPTRTELEQKADELGIKYRSDIKDESLLAKINEALKV